MLNYSINHTEDLERVLNEKGYRLLSYDFFGQQLRNCQAWIIEGSIESMNDGDVESIYILQSYNTLVAFILDGVCYRCGRWSTTTSKQTTWFEREYC